MFRVNTKEVLKTGKKDEIPLHMDSGTRTTYPVELDKGFAGRVLEDYLDREKLGGERRARLPRRCDGSSRDRDIGKF